MSSEQASQAPAAIEGRRLSVRGLDIRPHGPPKQLKSGELVFPLTVNRGGKSTILEENTPKKQRFRPYALLDAGSGVAGKLLWGFSSFPLRRDSIEVGGSGRTAAHSGQSTQIEGACLMEIVRGWRGESLPIHPQSLPPEMLRLDS
ncbi:MAG: hypothetical protein CVU64_02030 [Deltaproteobacteria bacterium HGW-Deltaproteobacteria-21]|nr:MAG: hypothetical protein CVU64_02030 [Deltaproteobacteria bacterium HGW-Deltaproteobacteria-21]